MIWRFFLVSYFVYNEREGLKVTGTWTRRLMLYTLETCCLLVVSYQRRLLLFPVNLVNQTLLRSNFHIRHKMSTCSLLPVSQIFLLTRAIQTSSYESYCCNEWPLPLTQSLSVATYPSQGYDGSGAYPRVWGGNALLTGCQCDEWWSVQFILVDKSPTDVTLIFR